MSLANNNKQGTFYRPVADGKIVRKISKEEYERRLANNPADDIRAREWTAGGESGISYEEYYDNLEGMIIGISFANHQKYGSSIQVKIQNGDEKGILSVSTAGGFGSSLMEAIPNIKLDEPVTINPWVKEKDGKTRNVLFVNQGEKNVESAIKTYDEEKRKWNILVEGYPEVDEKEKEKFGDKYWSRHYGEVEVFLINYIKANMKIEEQVEAQAQAKTTPPSDGDDPGF